MSDEMPDVILMDIGSIKRLEGRGTSGKVTAYLSTPFVQKMYALKAESVPRELVEQLIESMGSVVGPDKARARAAIKAIREQMNE
jgi:hypothetical protein